MQISTNARKILTKLQTLSTQLIENPEAVLEYIEQSLQKGTPITLYNWECPPRFLDVTKDGTPFVNYDVDLEKVFDGKQIDEFTELPRVVESADAERATLRFMQDLGVNLQFYKVIADTNAYYLTPETLDIIGRKCVERKFNEFKERIAEEVQNYPTQVRVIGFTDLIKPFRLGYERVYAQSKAVLEQNPEQLLPQGIFEQQCERTREHMGMTDTEQIRDFATKTIATYAAEGIIFELLNTTEKFANNVWLNNHEVDNRTICITNCYRNKKGLSNIPMIFVD